MANVRDEQTTKTAVNTTDTVGNTPEVQVYDNNKQRTMTTPTSAPATRSTVNWGAIILGILVVLALIYFFIWYF